MLVDVAPFVAIAVSEAPFVAIAVFVANVEHDAVSKRTPVLEPQRTGCTVALQVFGSCNNRHMPL